MNRIEPLIKTVDNTCIQSREKTGGGFCTCSKGGGGGKKCSGRKKREGKEVEERGEDGSGNSTACRTCEKKRIRKSTAALTARPVNGDTKQPDVLQCKEGGKGVHSELKLSKGSQHNTGGMEK